jgi:hypothetical protein
VRSWRLRHPSLTVHDLGLMATQKLPLPRGDAEFKRANISFLSALDAHTRSTIAQSVASLHLFQTFELAEAALRRRPRRSVRILVRGFQSCANIFDKLVNLNAKRSTLFAKQKVLFDFSDLRFGNAAQQIRFESFTPRVMS